MAKLPSINPTAINISRVKLPLFC